MPKSREVVSSTSGSDSDSEVEKNKAKRKKASAPPEKPEAKKPKLSGEGSRPGAGGSSKAADSKTEAGMFQVSHLWVTDAGNAATATLSDCYRLYNTFDCARTPLCVSGSISLNPEQWTQLKDQMSEIDDAIKRT
ncbi:unnamed protein product [Oncorhynchus mykiss]|uniref:Activated RNA polymerase II transcriptional coactivator p15 n=1 Tax=Oncorhynchus mykiss TaxID=8022 RepID=A0A060YEH0_ONCMY|nr:unnamed protein product [Oncorhynchus mykiss]